MNEENKMWREYRQEQKERRTERRKVMGETFSKLIAEGYEVKRITDYHYRINGLLDIFPTHGKYHDLTKSPQIYNHYPNDTLYGFITDFFKALQKR